MFSSTSQRPAVRSATRRMRDQIASVKKHMSFIDESAVAVAPTETIEDEPTSQDIQPESPCIIRENYVCHSSIELIPIQRLFQNHYEYQFVKPADVTELSHDGWEVWTPKTISDDMNDAHQVAAETCTCRPASYRIRYGDVVHLRPERCVSGWGDWDTYRPGQIIEGHEDTKDWHAPTEGPFMTKLQDGTGRFGIDLVKLVNEQTRGCLTLREAIDLYREQVKHEDSKEFQECDFCEGDGAGSAKVLFRV